MSRLCAMKKATSYAPCAHRDTPKGVRRREKVWEGVRKCERLWGDRTCENIMLPKSMKAHPPEKRS